MTVLMAVSMLSASFVSCHTGSDADTQKQTVTVAPARHSIKGLVFDQDGRVLTGVTVTINGVVVPMNGNAFELSGLSDGKYIVSASKAGYKSSDASSASYDMRATYELVNGQQIPVSQDVECVLYLIKEESALITFGPTGASDHIVLESSTQDLYGNGDQIVGNTQDPSDPSLNSEVGVTAEVPGLTTAEATQILNQLPAGTTLNDVKFWLRNLTSLADALNKPSKTRAIVIAGEELPGQHTFFTGVKLETLYPVDFSLVAGSSVTVDITLDMADDVKKATQLYRSMGDGTWTEISATTKADGIASVDYSQSGKVIIKLYKLENQSFALGAIIDKTDEVSETDPIQSEPIVNNTSSDMTVRGIDYTAMSTGIVLTNLTRGSMVDYLRKIVMRHYKVRAIEQAAPVKKTYTFTPVYTLPADGTLYLQGHQQKTVSVYSIYNGTSSFRAEEFGEVFVSPYALVTSTEEPTHHMGGSND